MIPLRKTLALVAAVTLLIASPALSLKRAKVGGDGYDFTVETFTSQPFTLSENLGEKATVLIFWAAWSEKSKEVLSDFQKIYAEHSGAGLQIVGVNVEHQDWDPSELGKIEKIATDSAATYPMLLDKEYTVYDDYGVVAVPTAVMLDGTGTVTGIMENYSSMMKLTFRDEILAQLGIGQEEDKAQAQQKMAYKPKGASSRYFGMGKSLAGKKRYKRALTQLEKAVKIDPDYAEAHRLLAEIYELLERSDDAATALARADELDGSTSAEGEKQAEVKAPAEKTTPTAAPDDNRDDTNGDAAPKAAPEKKPDDPNNV